MQASRRFCLYCVRNYELSYKTLGIQEGGSAQRLWMEAVLDGTRAGEKEKILADLLEYCGLDTLAMVEIFRRLSVNHKNQYGP